MSKRKGYEAFPGWFFGPGGQQLLCNSEAEVPKGWTDNQAEAVAADEKGSKTTKAPAEAKPKPPADAAAAPAAETSAAAKPATAKQPNALAIARANYKEVTGKGVSPKWDVDAINTKIAEHKAAAAGTHDL
jgi:hypothetical protein